MQTPILWEPVDVTPILKDGKTAIPDNAITSGTFPQLNRFRNALISVV
jgi:hypothetical protein